MGGRGQRGTQGGNVKNGERGMQRERKERRREIGIDWGQTWSLIEGSDQWR